MDHQELTMRHEGIDPSNERAWTVPARAHWPFPDTSTPPNLAKDTGKPDERNRHQRSVATQINPIWIAAKLLTSHRGLRASPP